MRPDNRLEPGGGRRCRMTVMFALCAALPSIGVPSAMGAALWSKVEFSAYTTLGMVDMKLSTTNGDDGFRLDQLKINVDGKLLRIPAGVDLHVQKPQLNAVEVTTTRSITCLEDECPDPTGWPVWLDIPFGEYAGSRDGGECERSLLRIDLETEGITSITLWLCEEGKQVERVLYLHESAGKH